MIKKPIYAYNVQAFYARQYGWEDVTQEDTRKEALQRLREYRENEPNYNHRIIKVQIREA
jgi:hypothetical protein